MTFKCETVPKCLWIIQQQNNKVLFSDWYSYVRLLMNIENLITQTKPQISISLYGWSPACNSAQNRMGINSF